MSAETGIDSALESFFDEGLISEIIYEVKSGKEATVFCCRGDGVLQTRHGLIAAKIYRERKSRGFRNDAMYQSGRVHLARPGRASRAVAKGSGFGQEVSQAMWIETEWETMNVLADAGVEMAPPLKRNDRSILMPFYGDEDGPAPLLHEIRPDRDTAKRIIDRLLIDIEIMLDHDRVHGDLSPYNILFWNDTATIIDFPQAVDPRLNPAGRELLFRDVENVCKWAARYGVNRPAAKIAGRLWRRFREGELG
jgi:RIO kinase 1